MQGKKTINPKMLYQVHLNDLVPEENFYRKLNAALNLRLLYKQTEKYYGDEGQQSIDPVVFFKICLVGYLNNIGSDRRLIEYCSNCLDVRLFIQYDIDEPLPWHSTISRTRQLFGEEIFLSLFKKVLSLCIEKGMVRGKRQAIDSAYLKANASMDSLVEKEILDDVEKYSKELNENSEYKISAEKKEEGEISPEKIIHHDKSTPTVTTEKKKQVERHHEWKKEEYKDQPSNVNSQQTDEHGNLIRPKFLSNHTHYSPTDPDARISVKPGKARQLNYSGQIAVDDAHHVITGALADFADKRDSESFSPIAEQSIQNLKEENITVEQMTADTAFSSGESLKFCEENNMDAYIPNFGQYKAVREGFVYNKEKVQYECTRGNKAILPFKKIQQSHNGYEMKVYTSSSKVCKNCPLRNQCIGKSNFKKITDSIDKPLYDKMHLKMQTNYAKRILRIRSATVEPVLGTLINFLNMKRINTRGIKQANKHVLLAASCYNLKKYLKFVQRKSVVKAQA
ncbi:MAG: IS1182 family transposase, partial [Nanoarchaeota archaeon]